MNIETESETQVEVKFESPGRMLAQMRESKSLTVAEVAQRLKYGTRQIEALEQDDFDRLSGTTFVRGMIRGYAKLLGIDPEPILCQFAKQNISGPMTVDLRAPQIPFPDASRRATRAYAVFSFVAIIVAGSVGFELYSGASLLADFEERFVNQEPQDTRLETTNFASIGPSDSVTRTETRGQPYLEANRIAAPAIEIPTESNESIAARPAHKRIALQFDRESWVEIRQADGKTLLSQLNPAGTQQLVEGIPPFLLTIGNAPSVRVSYENQPVDLRPHFKVDVARLTLE